MPTPRGFGWRPDPPDHRDLTEESGEIASLLASLSASDDAEEIPSSIAWCEYFPPVDDQQQLPTATAHACAALVQFFERLATGNRVEPSRAFLYRAAGWMLRRNGRFSCNLRATLAALTRFGAPPEAYFPTDLEHLEAEPQTFCLGYAERYRSVRYVRLDGAGKSGREILDAVRAFLAAGFVSAFGLSICSSISEEADIPFPTIHDSLLGGQAMVAVGYDDARRVRSEKGALLVRNSWGKNWGNHGYGWLPYAYVRRRMAVDFWTLVRPEWLSSGEFRRPVSHAD